MSTVTLGFELAGVAVIIVGFIVAVVRAAIALLRPNADATAYAVMRSTFGRSILLGLELLVAADLIRTVTLELTLENLLSLGILVLIRIVLGWSLEVEIDGRWPWQRAKAAAEGGTNS